MAFLIVEDNFEEVKSGMVIDEATQKKKYFIEGVFLQAEQKNKNNRIYPASILEREVMRYTNEYIDNNRSLGELNHPQSPSVNPERACHFIKSLRREGNNWIGKSMITSTPVGDIVKGLLDDGVQLGVSSRGLGTLSEKRGFKQVNEDYHMSTIDVVSDPSAPAAWVNGIYEGKEWAVQGEDEFVEKIKKHIDNEVSKKGFSMVEEFILMEKMNKFFDVVGEKMINESKLYPVGTWLKQVKKEFAHGNEWEDSGYAIVVEELKGGSNKVITVEFDGANAVLKSTKGWHPQPTKISMKDVPAGTLKKIKAKLAKTKYKGMSI